MSLRIVYYPFLPFSNTRKALEERKEGTKKGHQGLSTEGESSASSSELYTDPDSDTDDPDPEGSLSRPDPREGKELLFLASICLTHRFLSACGC